MSVDSLADLHDRIVASGNDAALQLPIVDFIQAVKLPRNARHALHEEAVLRHIPTLGDLLQNATACARVLRRLSPSERDDFQDAAADWLELETAARELAETRLPNKQPVEKRAAPVDMPPSGSEALQRWAEQHGIAHLLRSDFSRFVGSHHLYGPRVPLIDFWANPKSDVRYFSPHEIQRISQELGDRLIQLAALGDEALIDERDFLANANARLADLAPAVATVVRDLLQKRTLVRAQSCAPLPNQPLPELRFSPRPPRVDTGFATQHIFYVPFAHFAETRIELFDAVNQGVRVRETSSLHVLLTIDALLVALLDPSDPLNAPLHHAITTPAWEQTLTAIDEALRESSEATGPLSIVSWRIFADARFTRIAPYLHKALKRGGHSSGTASDAFKLATAKHVSFLPADTALVRLQRAEAQAFSPRALCEQLLVLVDHPRVFNEAQEPVRVVRAQPAITLEPTTDGAWRVKVLIDDQALAPEEVPDSDGYGFVYREHRLAVFKMSASERALLAALSAFDAAIPQAIIEKVVSRLQQSSAPLVLPQALRGEAIEASTRPVLRLAPEAQVLHLEFFVRPLGMPPLVRAGVGAPTLSGERDGKRFYVVRDFVAERAAVAAAAAALSLELEDDKAFVMGEWRMLELLGRLREIDSVAVDWLLDPLSVTKPLPAQGVQLRVRASQDWFGIEGEAELEGEKFDLALLLDALRRGDKFIKVGERRWLQLEEQLRERLELVALASHAGKHGAEIALSGAAALDALQAAGARLELDLKFAAVVEQIKRADFARPALPETLEAELRPYQQEGFEWLCRLEAWGTGGILADDMGLGKTVQALAMLLRRAPLGPALVMMPTSLEFNWMREAERFAPTLRVRAYRALGALPGDLGAGDVILVSYGLLARDGEKLAQQRFATAIFDEAQALKNPDTLRAKAARALHYDWAIALTGTPIENRTSDLWSLMRLVAPGLLGSWEQFRARFAVPIEGDNNTTRRKQLSRLLRPFVLRRTKALVLDELPEKTEIDIAVVLSSDERELYERARLAAIARIQKASERGPGDARFSALAALTELRRLVCHPRLYDQATAAPASKLETFLRMVDDLAANHHRALVFSQFTSHLALVKEALDARGISYQYLDGQTPEHERARRVDAFQRGDGLLFLISLKAGGLGLNLTAADYVFHMDPWWNPAVEAQASGRAHRIGQHRNVTVYRLIAKDTIEEKIVALHKDKRELADALLGESEGGAHLPPEDVLALLRESLV